MQQITADVAALAPASEETIHTQIGVGAVAVFLNLSDMAATDELIIRHIISFPTAGDTVAGSKTIEHGVSTDPTWSATAGDPEADGWQSWPLAFGEDGGTITLESLSGTYDVEYVVVAIAGPLG